MNWRQNRHQRRHLRLYALLMDARVRCFTVAFSTDVMNVNAKKV